MDTITIRQARTIHLAALGLLTPPSAPAGREDVLVCIRRMGLLQIDTISVVARSPYMVLFSRLGPYSQSWLEEWLAAGKLFEYWGHAACFIPIEDYALFRRAMLEGNHPNYNDPAWLESQQGTIKMVRERIRLEGPLRSADFDQSKRPGTWWSWKDEKHILEHLFNQGELMIARREKFQRIYDLQEKILPGWQDDRLPDPEEIVLTLVEKTVQSLGLTRAEWVADYYRLPKRNIPGVLKTLVQKEKLQQVQVEGFEEPWFIHPQSCKWLEGALHGSLISTHTTLLSPFDPLVWDRGRARQFFNFDFSLECYLPASKRRYGYYCLPILHRGELVGRLDAKAHRKDKIFEVKKIFLEENREPDNGLLQDLAQAILACAQWHACPRVVISASEPPDFAEKLTTFLYI